MKKLLFVMLLLVFLLGCQQYKISSEKVSSTPAPGKQVENVVEKKVLTEEYEEEYEEYSKQPIESENEEYEEEYEEYSKQPIESEESTLSSTNTVIIEGFSFKPEVLTVSKGSTVVWEQKDSIPHTVTGKSFDSGTLRKGKKFTQTFNEAGTYTYKCSIHPSMRGTIIVE